MTQKPSPIQSSAQTLVQQYVLDLQAQRLPPEEIRNRLLQLRADAEKRLVAYRHLHQSPQNPTA